MIKQRQILSQLLNKERVRVTPKNYLLRIKIFLGFLAMLCASSIGLLLLLNEMSFLLLGFCATIAVTSLVIIYLLLKVLSSVAIKGNTLIINSLTKPSKVTSLRSIRRVQTKNTLGLSMTKINYSLDGRNNIVRFIDIASAMPMKPETILNNAIKRSKKQKANHKPGPVTVN